jgi:transcriptional regulator with XRE-family HTH domain
MPRPGVEDGAKTLTMQTPAVGAYIRQWRQRRRPSQLDLACDGEVSTRHLSFLETGQFAPSREMVLRLAERLQVPMRDRNVLPVAAGFAPLFPERGLADPQLDAGRHRRGPREPGADVAELADGRMRRVIGSLDKVPAAA